MMPRGPSATSSTARVSMTIVTVTSQRDARSAGEDALAAPAAMRGAIASALRANTVTVCPPFNKLRAMGAPIAPSPITPTLAMRSFPSLTTKTQRRRERLSKISVRSRVSAVRHGNFLGRAQPRLDRAIHVSLPSQARMLSGEEDAVEGPREPVAERGWKLRVEERITATRPCLLFPAQRGPCHELAVLQV